MIDQGAGTVAPAARIESPTLIVPAATREGSIFENLGLHHIGVWADDPRAESERLDAIGWARESVTVRPDGSWVGGLYHLGTGGLRVEVVDIGSSGPKLACYLNGGDYGAPPAPSEPS